MSAFVSCISFAKMVLLFSSIQLNQHKQEVNRTKEMPVSLYEANYAAVSSLDSSIEHSFAIGNFFLIELIPPRTYFQSQGS
jgi:hypothetical protein